jgi:NAD(P)-dependent dehydrogenase (short-subunit alcohol dehydrogenase family)
MTEADWDRVVSVNLKGTFFCCRYAIPELRKTQGCIVNLSSDAGVVGTPETAIYTASKGGVSLLTKSLALELAPDLVRVNAVCPADVMSPMLRYQADTYGHGDPEGYFKRLLGSYAQGARARFIRPDEVAELVCYLAGEKAAPITGALLTIDFGTSAGYGYA